MAQAAREETFDGTSGLKIFFRSWRPEGKLRAVIVICHGVNSHGGQYVWVAEQFVKAGTGSARPREIGGRAVLYHDLLNDIGKEGVMADITAWIDKRLPS